ncbi:hypothetical protein C6499_12545 [Candidatus Poribacteria bacterium]|nr:MAG: hypothetical protein C6499_12545 [Candidatus Poribacteria bacterium]
MNESQAPIFRGEEGSIWYVKIKDTNEIRLYKCKPHRIEQVHWSQTQTQLSTTVIWAAILKAFENWENLELDEIIAILNEDYPIHKITISMGQIKQMFNTAKNTVDTEKKIWELMVMHELEVTPTQQQCSIKSQTNLIRTRDSFTNRLRTWKK